MKAALLKSRIPPVVCRSLDGVIRLVAEGPSDDIIPRLERTAKKRNGLMPGMCAWALAVYYKRINQMEKSAEFKELLRMSVPYSSPMKNVGQTLSSAQSP